MIEGLKLTVDDVRQSSKMTHLLGVMGNKILSLDLFRWLYERDYDLTLLAGNWCTYIVLTEDGVTDASVPDADLLDDKNFQSVLSKVELLG